VLKKPFGRNASEHERANELRKLNAALLARVQKYEKETDTAPERPVADKPE
jgi:hypothetical protein